MTVVIWLILALSLKAYARQQSEADLRSQVNQLQTQLTATQGQLAQSQQQIEELRKELQEIRALVGPQAAQQQPAQQGSSDTSGTFPTLQNAVKESKQEAPTTSEDHQLLAARVEEQEQTKVESASRYKIRLSGLILMNAYTNVAILL
jgi:chromosome segregation ATPase